MSMLLNTGLEVISIGALLVLAALIVAIGSLRAVLLARKAKSQADGTGSTFQPATLRWQHALMFPIIGSIMLATLYLAFAYIQHFLILYIVFAAAAAVAFTCIPICARGSDAQRSRFLPAATNRADVEAVAASSSMHVDRTSLLGCSWASVSASTAVAAVTVIGWAWLGGPLLTNTVGIAMCIAMLSLVRLPSLRVAAVLLFALLIYDFYWVFLSHKHFGDNVMLHVATQEASNPVHAAAAAVAAVAVPGGEQTVAAFLPVMQLSPPNKLEFPVLQWRPHTQDHSAAIDSAASSNIAAAASAESASSGGSWVVAWMMLGLGDIALPGMLAALAHAIDDAVRRGDCDDARSGPAALAAVDGAAMPVRLHVASGGQGSALHQQGISAFLTRLLCRFTAARRLRRELWDRPGPSLFRTCMLGYVAGLIVTFIAGRWMRAAQPALVYIVPCTVIPVWLHARRIGGRTLSLLWAGLPDPPQAASQPSPAAAVAPDTVSSDSSEHGVARSDGGTGLHEGLAAASSLSADPHSGIDSAVAASAATSAKPRPGRRVEV